MADALDTLPSARRALLTALKRAGEARADELAGTLGVTVSAVRQHVAALTDDGLVAHRVVRRGPGRPAHLYRLSEMGDGLFPRAYGAIVTDLLGELELVAPEMVDTLFERRRLRRAERANARLAGLGFDEQVAELTRILDEDGYLADAVPGPEGSWRIVEHNCAILAVAAKYGAACGTELEFIRDVLPGAVVERVAHLMAGGHVCAYEVTPRVLAAPSVRRRRPRKPSPTS
ncbi:MAG: helix-turn-helix transcriptional regulator [Acidimicrobiales bacterium]